MEPETKTFDVLEFLAGVKYPQDTVTVYANPAALYEYENLDRMANNSDNPDEFAPRLEELREQIRQSAVIFHLRGYAPKLQKAIMAEARALHKVPDDQYIESNTKAFRWVNLRCIAESLVKVERPDGSADERRFTVEDVEGFEDGLPDSEFGKIQDKTFELSFRSLSFDAAVTPDFS